MNGRDVVAESWGSGPVVYLMHGWGGERRQLGAFVEPLLANGRRVIAIDAPGHGESAPGSMGRRRGLLNEFSEALAAATKVYGQATGVVAHSLGAVGSGLAVLDGMPADRLVMISPAADPVTYSREFASALGFGERIRTGFLARLERRVGRPMSAFNLPDRARTATSLPPVLVIHDKQDRQIAYRDGVAIAEAWPDDAELLSTDGLGHYRILRDPEVVGHAVAFLTLPPAAAASWSGAADVEAS